MIDLADFNLNFRHLLVISMGRWGQDDPLLALRLGLQTATSPLTHLGNSLQIDVAALGTQFSSVTRRQAFDLISDWALDLHHVTQSVAHIRLVAYDLDTFIDFYEALHRLKRWTEKAMVMDIAFDPNQYGEYKIDVSTAASAISSNPKQVLVICRTIVESLVQKLAQQCNLTGKTLFDNLGELAKRNAFPRHIESYLHTCRVLGNFSNHSCDFKPSERDAQAVMLLTLKIVEWYLEQASCLIKS